MIIRHTLSSKWRVPFLRPLFSSKAPNRTISSTSIKEAQTAVFTWGVGTSGQLGHERFKLQQSWKGDSYIQEEPRRLLKSKTYTALACGREFSLGLTGSGDIYGWGRGFAGKDSQSNIPLPLDMSAVKDLGRHIVKIAAGPEHAAAIDNEGHVLTWGNNGGWYDGGGQLGHGNTDSLSKPTYVESFISYGAKAKHVSLGTQHTLILTADGEVLACGHGEYGRIGTGNLENVESPETVEELLDETIIQVSAGNSFSMALAENGNLYMWGKNDTGQLGIKDTMIDIYSMEAYPQLLDIKKLFGESPVSIHAGFKRACVVTDKGSLLVWGHKLSHFPTLVDRDAFDGKRVKAAFCAGENHRCLVVVTEDDALWTLGHSKSNMLGWRGATGLITDPVLIGKGAWDDRPVRGVYVGFNHAGVIADMV
eukprot:GSChrysophyteH1.ASY1.ANO1.2727.1 assembled CDS